MFNNQGEEMKNIIKFVATITFAMFLCSDVFARNVDLSTVPARDTVQLTIYNSEDLTLVRETRKLTFKDGLNGLQFSWVNTLIDPSSVELRFLTNPEKLSLLDTTFPHDKPQMLYWNVMSDGDMEAAVEISYFTSGISWSADYVLTSNAEETSLAMEGYVRVINNSGEDYESAQVRLVVGTINLVEAIAHLAQFKPGKESLKRSGAYSEMRRALDKAELPAAMLGAAMADSESGMGFRQRLEKPKEIVKEGLSEYFIFTIPGTETIPNGWSKRMRFVDAEEVPFKIQYRYRPKQYGDRLVRLYIMTNDEESKLGESPMPDGTVRVFRQNGREGLSYLAQENTKYIPIGDKIEVNLGTDPEVIFELIKLRAYRDEIWMHLQGVDVFRKVGDQGVEIDVRSSVAGWNDNSLYTQRIRNYTAKPIEAEIRRTFQGHVDFVSELPGIKLYDFQTPEFTTTVDAGEKVDCLFRVSMYQGRNQKQSSVTLVNEKPDR
jgi:hypothetical protein